MKMPKSTSERSKNGSEGSSRSERRRAEDDEASEIRARVDSTTASGTSRRRSSKRDGEDEGFMPKTTSFSSSSRSPYSGVAAPSVASSYATALPNEHPEYNRPDLVRNESMAQAGKKQRKEARRDSGRTSQGERSRGIEEAHDSGNVDRADAVQSGRRESRKSSGSDKKEKTQSQNEHDNALPQHQFPGQSPAQYTEPYRPPGLASDYYGDHGESVSSQPGVRPNAPSIIQTADQAHLMEPTVEAKPPAEPSSIGQVGASASFYAMDGSASDGANQSTPTKPGRKSSKKPTKYNNEGTSRSSPEDGRVSSSGMGLATGGAAMGAAAEYFTGNVSTTTTEQASQSAQSRMPYQTASPESFITPTGPSRLSNMDSGSSSHHYGSAAAAGLAGAAAGAYFTDHGNRGSGSQSGYPPNRPNPEFVLGQNQSAFPQMQRRRTKPRGPLGKLANWWKAPEDVAQMEAYTEAIGVCRDCFDPGSSPMDAPRRHHHHRRRRSNDVYGNTTRVDKTYRYSSDEERRRSSTAAKLAAGGLAGYGAAKIGQAVYKQKNDFDDTYSVKSGRPANRSRVSFKENDEHFSARTYSNTSQNTTALERRDSGRKSRYDSEQYEKRSSRRRDSSSDSSSHGMSKTTVMGIGAASIAVGAAAARERRRSRSRSRSPIKRKRSYYHQRISPRHSYVDLSTTNQGSLGLGGFFSPSSNEKKGKKAKGFFSFSNASSSSSDADLAFGQGTVKRKDSRKGPSSDKYDDGSTAALLGLAATGAALAAESDRRKSKSKDRRYADEPTDRQRRTSTGKVHLADYETTTAGENDDAWEDATDDDNNAASADSGLAYGGRASAARESLPQTDYWQWRKKKSREDLRRQSRSDANGTDTAVAGGIALAAGAAALNDMDSGKLLERRPDSLPAMQQLDPVPTSDPTFFEARRTSGTPPRSSERPQSFADASPIPLQQPQPITPVASIPDAFDRYEDEKAGGRRRRGSVDRARPSHVDDRRRQRRDSSPAKLESGGDRADASRDVIDANEDDIRARREAEIEAELQKLYNEDRRRKGERRKRKEDDRKRKVEVEVAGVAATAAVVGAGIAGVVASRDRSSSEERERPKRKSSMKKSKDRASSPPSQTQQERIARMAAQRVRSTPSPVHEDYGTFFIPKELTEHIKEHNEASAARDEDAAQVVEIVPGGPKRAETFDSFLYRPFGIEPDDDPTAYPWPVPMLGLVEPTPPVSVTHSRRGTPSPVVKPKDLPDEDFGEPMERKSSKVTWGDHDTYVYEVVTPEWERADFMADSPDKSRSPRTEVPPSMDQQETTKEPRPRSKLSRIYTLDAEDEDNSVSTSGVPPVEEMTVEQREHLSKGHDFADMPGSFEDREPVQEDHEPTPAVEVDLEDVLGSGQSYRSPFSETVGDLKGEVPDTSLGFIEDTKLPATPNDEETSMSGGVHDEDEVGDVREVVPEPRQSRSEQRRMERVAPPAEAVPMTFENAAPPPPPPPMPTATDLKQTPTSTVFDYLVGDDGKSLPSASALGATASSVLTSGKVSTRDASGATSDPKQDRSAMLDDIKNFKFSRPVRAETFDDTKTGRRSSKSKTDYTSDPEDWERSSSKKDISKSSKSDVSAGGMAAMAGIAAAAAAAAKNREVDIYNKDKRTSRKSQQESENIDVDDAKSVSSTKGKRTPKRDSGTKDDGDAVSVATSTTSRKSKKSSDDKKDKSASGGIWGSIFGTKSDVSSFSKKPSKSTKSQGQDERSPGDSGKSRKRRSGVVDIDDATAADSEPPLDARRHSGLQTDARDVVEASRDETIDDEFASADEHAANVSTVQHPDESLKAERLEMSQPMDIPMATDGVSGLETEGLPPALPSISHTHPLSPDQAARNATLRALVGETSPMAPDVSWETRKASQLKTSDIPASPATTNSPTAVPFRYQRLPISPATPRASWSSPIATPSSPLRTPRTRQDRPKSTEFRSSKEVRPLYLVQKTKAEQTPTPEVEEDLPSLPSSRTSSAHPSMEDLHGAARAHSQERIDSYFPSQDMTPQQRLDRGRRQSWSYWHDTPDTAQRRISPDYLDSRSATPVPADVQRAREVDTRSRRERPKYEFHSPSELLEDPAGVVDEAGGPALKSGSPLPSVVSTEVDAEFMNARSGSPATTTNDFERRRSRSRSKSRSRGRGETLATAGLGIAAVAAIGVTASEVVASRKRRADGDKEIEDTHSGEALRSAQSPPPSDSSKIDAPATEEGSQPTSTTDTPAEELDEWAVPTKKSKKEKRKSKSKGVAESPAPVAPVTTTPAEAEDDWAQSAGKKSKKDKKKRGKRQDSLPTLDIEAAEARGVDGERALLPDEDEPLTAVPSEKSMQGESSYQHGDLEASIDLEPEVQDFAETLVQRGVSLPEQVAFTGDLTPSSHRALLGNLNAPLAEEEAQELGVPETIPEDSPLDHSRDVTKTPSGERAADLSGDVAAFGFPSDDPDTRELERTASFVPSSELLNSGKNDLGAFEEAFERAIRARGLGEGITREDALEVFLPKRENAAFVAKGGLTPINGSLAPTPENSESAEDMSSKQSDLAPSVATALSSAATEAAVSKKSKKDKKKSKKAGKRGSSGLRDSTLSEDEESSGKRALSEAQTVSEKPLSFSNDSVPQDTAPQETLQETSAVSDSGERPNPFGNDFEIREADNVFQPVPADDSGATRDLQGKAAEAAGDEWAPSSSKKAKKDKKKKRQTLDWTDDVAPAAAVAAAVGAGAAAAANMLADDKDKEVVAEPEDIAEAAGDPAPAPQDVVAEDTTKAARDVEPSSTKPEQPDDFADSQTPGKKSKKDKKKKKSKTFDWDALPSETPESTTTPAEDLTVDSATGPTGPTEEPQSYLEASVATEAEPPTKAEEAPAGSETPGEVVDDAWAPTPTKSKKDKKKAKKSKTLELGDLENELTAQEVTPAPEEAVRSKEVAEPENFDAVANDKDLNLPSIASSVPSIPDVETLEHADRLASASSKDLHDAPSHQDFLAFANANVSAFPSRPAEPSKLAAEKDLEVTSTQAALASEVIIPVEEPAADEFAFTTKKSKKDKKKARKSVQSAETGDSLPSEGLSERDLSPSKGPAEPPSDSSEPLRRTSNEITEAVAEDFTQEQERILPLTVAGKDVVESPERTNANDKSTEAIETSTESPPQEPGWFAWATGKNSKKDKKKDNKRSSVAWDVPKTALPVPGPVSQDPPPEDADAEKAVAAAFDEDPAETLRDQQDNLSWEPSTTAKKSKKDKKKRKSLAWADDDGMPLVTTPENEQDDHPAVVHAEEAAAVDTRVDEHIVEEPEQIGASGIERLVDPQPHSSTTEEERDLSSTSREPDLVVSSSMAADTPDLAAPDPVPSDTHELRATEEAATPAEPEDLAWAPSTKKSKKDKKKKRTAVFDLDESVEWSTPQAKPSGENEAIPAQEVPVAAPAKDEEISTQQVPVVQHAVADEDWGFATKKGKKDKKKNRASKFDPDELVESFPAETEAVLAEVEAPVQEAFAAKPAAEDDDWGFASKKSKTDKKKKRVSTFGLDDSTPATPAAETSVEPLTEPSLESDRMAEYFPSDHGLAAPIDDTLAPEIVEDEWAVPTKKSKEDKKKKRASGFASEDVTPGIETTVDELGDAGREVVSESLPAETTSQPISDENFPEPERVPTPVDVTAAPESDPWDFSTKRSKKDKKKRNFVPGAFGLDESGTATPTTPTETETRDPEDRQPLDDSGTHYIVPQADSTSYDEPMTKVSVQAPSGAVQDIAMSSRAHGEGDAVEQLSLAGKPPGNIGEAAQAAPEPTADEEWGFPTKKSKKDKKNKRQSTIEDLTESATPDVDTSAIATPVEPTVDFVSEPASIAEEPSALDAARIQPFDNENAADGGDRPIDWARDPWAMTAKKSKTNKKKSKSGVDKSDRDLGESVDSSRRAEGISVAPSAQEKAAWLIAEAFGQSSRSPSRSREERPIEEPAEALVSSRDVKPESIPDTMTLQSGEGTDQAPEEEWGFSTKRLNKDKKKKRQSGADDISSAAIEEPATGARAIEEDRQLSVQEHDNLPAHQDFLAGAHENASSFPVHSTHDVKDVVDHNSSLGSGTARAVRDNGEEPRQPEPMSTTRKKSKKDKKMKRQSAYEEEEPSTDVTTPVREEAQPAGATRDMSYDVSAQQQVPALDRYAGEVVDKPAEDIVHEVGEIDDWQASVKKSKKDKKKKKRQSELDDLTGEEPMPKSLDPHSDLPRTDPRDVDATGEVPRIDHDGVTRDPETEGRHPSRYEHDVVAMGDDLPERFEAPSPPPAAYMQESGPQSMQSFEDDSYAAPKLKKGKKGNKLRTSTNDYYSGSPTYDLGASSSRAAPVGEPRDLVMGGSDHDSQVSDSTRERRKRRRSPPLQLGHDPQDLPRHGALTPPPEGHQDIMNTALGVAAGMGLAGSDQAHERDHESSRHRVAPRDDPSWSFSNVPSSKHHLNGAERDSGVTLTDSPMLGQARAGNVRDSGYAQSPSNRHSWAQEPEHESHPRPTRPQSPTSSAEDLRGTQRDTRDTGRSSRDLETPIRRHPSSIESTSKDRSSVVFNSSPAGPSPYGPHVDTSAATLGTPTNIARSPSIHGHHRSREAVRAYNEQRERHGSDSMASNLIHRASSTGVDRATFSPPPSSHLSGTFSPPRSPLPAIHEHRQSNDFAKGAATAAGIGAGAVSLSRDATASPSAKSLGRSKSRTSSLRNLRGSLTSLNDKYEAGPSSSSVNGKGAAREAIGGEMADFVSIFLTAVAGTRIGLLGDLHANIKKDGYGHAPGTPQSPTRPPSITKRRSMQQIQDLQTRVDLLASENRSLAEQKMMAERHLEEIALERNRGDIGAEDGNIKDRDEEIMRLRQEVGELMAQHEQERGQWDENSRELETLKGQHTELSTGMEEIVRHEIEVAVREKTAELERLYGDLELAKEKIRELQSQVLRKSMDDDVIVVRDEDYFDNACQTLCQHVQQWVLRFSKFSDTRICRTTNEVRDDKVIDRFDNAVLDGSEVDGYLGDRVKRRDVFMSVVMTMIWEYVFTRYLFGMDRDQRQKIKQLEKNLAEVGTTAQIHQWRAMTLTLLSQRTAFKDLCENETEGVAMEIFNTLGRFLPPPGNLEQQIMESLRNVMRAAVTLSIEMRTQKAEYIMLPPLQPEYDTNGDLARKVYFNASLMNERSGKFTSNDELQAQQAVVRMVLFPLVVKKGNDEGEGEEEIVVCPAQVLVARVDKGKKRRSSGKSRGPSGQMSVPQSMAGQSTHSLAMSGVEPTGDGRPI